MGLFQRLFGDGLRFPLNVDELARGPKNDARAYGVIVREPKAAPGDTIFRVLRVHHLTPEENRGNHHIYVEVLDEDGRRIPGAQVRISWEGGSRVFTVDARPQRPGVAFAMDRWGVYEVDVLGAPSARVVGITAGHPDEGPGNPEFRHSFLIVFQRERVAVPEAITPVPPVEEVQAPPLDAQPAKEEEERVLPTPAEEAQAVPSAEPEPAETATVQAEERETSVQPEVSEEAPAAAEPTSPEEAAATPIPPESPGYVFDTYVLFVDAEAPSTLAAFFVAMDDILSTGVPFGFDTVDVATQARRVIVIGEAPAQTLARLRDQCEDVITVEGDGDIIRETLQDALSVG